MAKNVVTALFISVGLLNLYPAVGAFSAEKLTLLYGIGIDSTDLDILMRHRAAMLGLIGSFLLVAAFRPAMQGPAASIGLVSMMSFVILAIAAGNFGAEIQVVVIADVAGSIVLAAAWVLAVKIRNTGLAGR